MSDKVRLYISVSSCRDWKTQFASSMLGLVHHLTMTGLGGRLEAMDFKIGAQASLLSQARQVVLSEAIARGFTHWMSFDDDMVFPCDVVDQLLSHDQDIVTANYRRKKDAVSGVCMGLDGQILDSTGKSGLEEIGWMGGGCFLADLRKLKEIPAPHFEVVWCPERNEYFDQDNVFCAKVRQHGMKIYCDHSLSQQIGHVGDYEYRFPKVMQPAMREVA